MREESVVLSNARSETRPKTPTKPAPPTDNIEGLVTPSTTSRSKSSTSDESEFGWSASNDKALVEAAQTAAMVPPETPRKTPRTSHFTSPGKRTHSEMVEASSHSGVSTSFSNDDIFNTPRTSQDVSGLLSPAETPVRGKLQDVIPPPSNSNLAADALRILGGNKLPSEVEQELVQLLNKHDLRTQGIAKGRDITRLALSNKEKKIAELEARIAGLEAERQTSKAVIARLKKDMVQTSPSKGRKRGS